MKNLKLIIAVLVMFSITILSATADWTNYKQNPQQTGSTFTGGVATSVIWSTTGNLGSGSKYDPIIKDFDGDGINEIIMRVGSTIKYYEFSSGSINEISSLSIIGSGSISLAEGQCPTARGGVVALSSGQVRLYCVNATNYLYLADTDSTAGYYNSEDGVTCEKLSGNPKCFFRSEAEKFTVCEISGGTITSCIERAYPHLLDTGSVIQTPPLKDIDGDNDLDAVWWCRNGTIGVEIVDENANSVMSCYTSSEHSSAVGGRMSPILISENNDVAFRGQQMEVVGANWELIDTTGTRVTKTTAGGKLGLCGESASYNPVGDALFVDTNDDGFQDKFCWAARVDTSVLEPSGEIYCSSESNWAESARTMEQCIAPAESSTGACSKGNICQSIFDGLASGNLDPLKTGDEIITSGNYRIGYNPMSYGGGKIVSPAQDETIGTFINNIDNNTVSDAGTTILTPTIADLDGNGDLDVLWTGESTFEIYYTSSLPPANSKPTIASVTLNPDTKLLNESQTVADYLQITPDGIDPESDTINVGVDCYYDNNDAREGIYTLDTTPYFGVGADQQPYLCPSTGSGAHLWKAYVGDPSHRKLSELNSETGYYITQNHTQPVYISVKVIDSGVPFGGFGYYVDSMTVVLSDFNIGGEEIVTEITDTNGEAYFLLGTNGTYNVTVYDSAPYPLFPQTTTTCNTTSSATTFCTIYMSATEITNYTMEIWVRDKNSLADIAGANVSIEELGLTETTNSNGIATFSEIESDTYNLKITATNYYDFNQWVNPENGNYVMYMQSVFAGVTNMDIQVLDFNSLTRIPLATVEVYEPISGYQDILLTDENGEVTFIDVPSSSAVIVGGEKENYDTNEITMFTGGENETTTHILFLTPLDTLSSDDLLTIGNKTIQKICGGIWVTEAREIKCTQDSDCFTGQCVATGHCSAFDWTYCDDNNRPRNQRCVFKGTVDCALTATTSWMLTNFLWMLVILIVVVALTFLTIAARKR